MVFIIATARCVCVAFAFRFLFFSFVKSSIVTSFVGLNCAGSSCSESQLIISWTESGSCSPLSFNTCIKLPVPPFTTVPAVFCLIDFNSFQINCWLSRSTDRVSQTARCHSFVIWGIVLGWEGARGEPPRHWFISPKLAPPRGSV